jgi:hypothetical protein
MTCDAIKRPTTQWSGDNVDAIDAHGVWAMALADAGAPRTDGS